VQATVGSWDLGRLGTIPDGCPRYSCIPGSPWQRLSSMEWTEWKGTGTKGMSMVEGQEGRREEHCSSRMTTVRQPSHFLLFPLRTGAGYWVLEARSSQGGNVPTTLRVSKVSLTNASQRAQRHVLAMQHFILLAPSSPVLRPPSLPPPCILQRFLFLPYHLSLSHLVAPSTWSIAPLGLCSNPILAHCQSLMIKGSCHYFSPRW
jgi:hypothetical protein